jgi:hypothetical protein
MPSEEQKRIWQKEKEDQLRDKQNMGRVVKKRKTKLQFGGTKKKKAAEPSQANTPQLSDNDSDSLMRQKLGL